MRSLAPPGEDTFRGYKVRIYHTSLDDQLYLLLNEIMEKKPTCSMSGWMSC